MADINSTLIPLVEPISNILGSLSILVGGVFGISIIMLVLKVREYFYTKKSLKRLHDDMFQLGRKVDAMSGELRRLKELNRQRLK